MIAEPKGENVRALTIDDYRGVDWVVWVRLDDGWADFLMAEHDTIERPHFQTECQECWTRESGLTLGGDLKGQIEEQLQDHERDA